VDLFQDLRSKSEDCGFYGIALSGFGMDEDIHRSLSAGFEHHITKPIEFAHLHKCLTDIGGKLAEKNRTPKA
jgi:YesN/AraC family two-component response regulator